MLERVPVVVSMLRGVNVVGRNKIQMDSLRQLCESLGLRDAQTYIQSGNVVCRAIANEHAKLAGRIEAAIEKKFGFRPGVMLRSAAELKGIIARNPFAKRSGIEPSKLLVIFFAVQPRLEMRSQILGAKTGHPEEVVFDGRELYIYFPNGQGRSKLWPAIDRALKKSGTGRNWNTVLKLLEMAEKMEGRS